MDEVLEKLDAVLAELEAGAKNRPPRDAIDDILDGAPRTTGVESLRDHPVVRRFRTELTDELIRADTVGQLLGLIQAALVAAP